VTVVRPRDQLNFAARERHSAIAKEIHTRVSARIGARGARIGPQRHVAQG
jgi:hypothetical protein